MPYTIPAATLAQLRQQATAAGMPYSTVLAQHIYDLQGLIALLRDEVTRAQATANDVQATPVDRATATKQLAAATRKLTEREAELAAYQQEQRTASP